MAKRKGKSSNKQDDSWLPAEPCTPPQPRAINEFVLPVILFLIVAVGGSWLGWIYTDQQQAIESLSETLMSLQGKINKLQQQFEPGAAQLASVGGLEERLVILEEAYAKAQRQVEIALATSEQIRSKDLHSKIWSLQTEMNSKLAELQQNTISIAALDAMIKNKTAELALVKQDVNAMLTANSELAITISGFTDTLSVTNSRFDEQSSVVDNLLSQLEGQRIEISEMQELFNFNQRAIGAHAQELIDLKELLEIEHVKKTHALGKQLRFLKKSLQTHQSKTEMLHSQLTARMETVQTQYLSRANQLDKDDTSQLKKFPATDSVKQDIADKKKQAHKEAAEFTEKQEFAEVPRASQEKESAPKEEINKNHEAEEKDRFSMDKETTMEKEMSEEQTPREEKEMSVKQETSQKQKMPEEQETVNTKELPKDFSAINSEEMRNEGQETKLKDEMPKKHQDGKKEISEEHQSIEKYNINKEKAINAEEISRKNEREHIAKKKKKDGAEEQKDVTVSEEIQTHLEETHINKKDERTTDTLVQLKDSVITEAKTGDAEVQMELTEEIQVLSKDLIKNEIEDSVIEFSDTDSNETPFEHTGMSSEEADMFENKNKKALNGKNIEHNVATDSHSQINEKYIKESEKNVDTENQPRSE